MATAIAVNANSLQGQITQLSNQFAAVERSAGSFETHQRRSTDLLHTALESVFNFGETLFAMTPPAGVSLVREFLVSNGTAYNSRTQANPYIGLVKLAFQGSGDSSRSQYATVLHFASVTKVLPADFKMWLAAGGIEGRRSEALDAQTSRIRQAKSQGRLTLVQQATTTLLSRPSSAAVALPSGIQVPQGFALVLAAIDVANNARIIDVVESDPQNVEPILLKLVGSQSKPASQEALAPFFRAIDLIVNTTPDAISGNARDIMIRNTAVGGAPAAIVQAISEAYSFPGASMVLDSHVGDLPQDEAFRLEASDAKHLLAQIDKFANWTLNASGALTADSLAQPVQLHALTVAGNFRIAHPNPDNSKPIQASQSQFSDIAAYIEREREDHARKNERRKEKRQFANSLELSIAGSHLEMRLPNSLLRVVFADTGAETELDGRTVAVDDVERLVATLSRYETDTSGWLMDGDVDDAAIVLETHFDNDSFRVILPTRTGTDYNQVCQPVVL